MTTATLETQTHLARCADCDYAVRYQPSSSGAGFTLLDSDAALGIGDNGRPICPEGHGEMELADDRLPATEAIAHAAEQIRLDAEKQRLPFPIPAYNYQGVLASLVDKRHEVAQLEKRVEGRKEALKQAKEDLDTANGELGRMIDQFEQDEIDRRQAVARQEADALARPERRAWCAARGKWRTQTRTAPCASTRNCARSRRMPRSTSSRSIGISTCRRAT
jgi:hypothetical protein